MSVTITRRHARKLAEQAIAEVIARGAEEMDPEIIGFREVTKTASALARGRNLVEDDDECIRCPMLAAGFDFDKSDIACQLAMAWDRVTREDGLAKTHVIRINPLT